MNQILSEKLKDLETNDFSDFSWENNRAVYYTINGEMKKVVIE